jgi:putative oxidoreductase
VLSAAGLAAFTVLASFIFHDFWAAPEAERMVQNLMFMKNLSVAGGLLVLAAVGPGAWSVDGM